MRECVNCKYSRGIGSDVWCDKGYETTYMQETECEHYTSMNTGDMPKQLNITKLISEYKHKTKGYKETIRQCNENIDREKEYLIKVIENHLQLKETDYTRMLEDNVVSIIIEDRILTHEDIKLIEELGCEYQISIDGDMELAVYLDKRRWVDYTSNDTKKGGDK